MSQNDKAILWSGVLVIKDRQVLTLKETDKPFYLLPGGKVDPGETDEDAAIREVREELGVKVELGEVFTEVIENSKHTGQLMRFKVFRATILTNLESHEFPERTEGIKWINSSYKQEGLEVGNFLIKLLPVLVEKDLID